MHVSLADIARTIGRRPAFPFQVDEAAAKGFSQDDRRELGHWAGEPINEESDEETESPPSPCQAEVASRGRGARGRGRGGRSRHLASQRSDMDLVYSRGVGRMGEESRQLPCAGACPALSAWLTLLGEAAGPRFRMTRALGGAFFSLGEAG
jgi:hypothetical protein